MEWQTHRWTESTYDVHPVETDSFPAEHGRYDICPLSGRVDDGRSHSSPAPDHPRMAIALDSAMGPAARLASRSLAESEAANGAGDPTAPHLGSASGLAAVWAGRMADTALAVGRNRSRCPAASAAIVVYMAFASPTEAAALNWAWLTGTVAAAHGGPRRGTALLPWDESVSVLDPVGSAGAVSRT